MKKVFLTSLMIVVSLVSCKIANTTFHKAYKEGQIIWQKQYDWDNFNSIQIDHLNNIYLSTQKYTIVDGHKNYYWAIIKLDALGNEDNGFNRSFDFKHIHGVLNVIKLSNSMNLFMAGTIIKNNNADMFDWQIKKHLNFKNEDLKWNKIVNSTKNDYFKALSIDSKGYVYIGGESFNLISENSNTDWWIKKFDSSAKEDKINWDKKIDGNGWHDNITEIAIDSKDNVYVVGSGRDLIDKTNSNWRLNSQPDCWLKKFSPQGREDILWEKKWDVNHHNDSIEAIAIDSKDNVYIGGYSNYLVNDKSRGDWWIKKFDSNGKEDKIYWDKKIDGRLNYDAVTDIAIDKYDNIYVIGFGFNLVNERSKKDWWIKKFGSNGKEDNTNWDLKIDGNREQEDVPSSVAVDNNGDIYVTGYGRDLLGYLTKEDLINLRNKNISTSTRKLLHKKASGFDAWVIKFKGPEQ